MTTIEKLVRDAMNDGFRMGVLQSADLLLNASQIPLMTDQEAKMLIDASRLVMELHKAPDRVPT
jgi:hypothetical protein